MHLCSEINSAQHLLGITLPVLRKLTILTANAWMCLDTDNSG